MYQSSFLKIKGINHSVTFAVHFNYKMYMYNYSDRRAKKQFLQFWSCKIDFLSGFLGAMVVVLDASNYWFHKSLL